MLARTSYERRAEKFLDEKLPALQGLQVEGLPPGYMAGFVGRNLPIVFQLVTIKFELDDLKAEARRQAAEDQKNGREVPAQWSDILYRTYGDMGKASDVALKYKDKIVAAYRDAFAAAAPAAPRPKARPAGPAPTFTLVGYANDEHPEYGPPVASLPYEDAIVLGVAPPPEEDEEDDEDELRQGEVLMSLAWYVRTHPGGALRARMLEEGEGITIGETRVRRFKAGKKDVSDIEAWDPREVAAREAAIVLGISIQNDDDEWGAEEKLTLAEFGQRFHGDDLEAARKLMPGKKGEDQPGEHEDLNVLEERRYRQGRVRYLGGRPFWTLIAKGPTEAQQPQPGDADIIIKDAGTRMPLADWIGAHPLDYAQAARIRMLPPGQRQAWKGVVIERCQDSGPCATDEHPDLYVPAEQSRRPPGAAAPPRKGGRLYRPGDRIMVAWPELRHETMAAIEADIKRGATREPAVAERVNEINTAYWSKLWHPDRGTMSPPLDSLGEGGGNPRRVTLFVAPGRPVIAVDRSGWDHPKYVGIVDAAAGPPQRAAAPPPAAPAAAATEVPPDEWTTKERTAANVAAIQTLASAQAEKRSLTAAERAAVLRYSGWGGLSIDAVEGKLPAGWEPESRGLIHEYYTPSRVAAELARLLRPFVATLPREGETIRALEPSAGIGRFVHALSGPGFEQLRWNAVEYSHVSAQLLQALRPDVQVFEGPFERFIAGEGAELTGKVDLLVSNPPYGTRGASAIEDPLGRKEYKEDKAYVYFLRRGLDLLRRQGIGCYIIPYGFLTGGSDAYQTLRAKVLRRHHLMGAFRLPSGIFPGALLVTDLLFFRARGGELAGVLPADQSIVDGKYFAEHPDHILGVEVGKPADEDTLTKKPRWGYQVEPRRGADGKPVPLTLPPLVERPMCIGCEVQSFQPVAPVKPGKRRRTVKELIALPLHIQGAIALGERVADYLKAVSQGDDGATKRAAALHPELAEALRAWALARAGGDVAAGSPYRDVELQKTLKAGGYPELVSFLSAFEENGRLAPAFAKAPKYAPKYTGQKDDLAAQADFLYRTERQLPEDRLVAFHERLAGKVPDPARLEAALVAAGWAKDEGGWLPERDYYTGNLWPRYHRAKALADGGDAQGAAQAARLLQAMRPATITDIDPEPRMPWVPVPVLRDWLSSWTKREAPALIWDQGMLRPEDKSQTDLALGHAPPMLTIALGYINHDYSLFIPPCSKGQKVDGEWESAEEALSRCRIEYHKAAGESFKAFLQGHPEHARSIEENYNRTFRGYVMPEFSAEDLEVARWNRTAPLHGYQRAGARRLIENRGGLLSFDVGLGKTRTGAAVIAKLRQEGAIRRPIVVVPNSIVWNWWKEFATVLPDYRVLVIGSHRYIGKNGLPTSRIDTPPERAMKWRQFQAGEADVAICTYSVFGRNQIRPDSIKGWIAETPPLLRDLARRSRNLLAELQKEERSGKERKAKPISRGALEKILGKEKVAVLSEDDLKLAAAKEGEKKFGQEERERAQLRKLYEHLAAIPERERAIFSEVVERWVAESLEHHDEPDPGIYWEDLKCDALFLDEAQNMKNLWPVGDREGGQPKFLGAISEGSDRAWQFAFRAAMVRKLNGGSGVYLLSATPAKNSPIEYFTLLGYVDGDAWTRLGITDVEVFIDRYLRLEFREILEPAKMEMVKRSAVVGFKNLDELRDIVFRYAEFKNGEDVKLPMPEARPEQLYVDMTDVQRGKYNKYRAELQEAMKRKGPGDNASKGKALGLYQKLAMVSIHPELDSGPLNKEGKPEWTWKNAKSASDYHSPKLDAVRDLVLGMPHCGHIIFCDNVGIHAWMREVLVEAGIARERIAILNAEEAQNPAKRQLVAEMFNGRPPIRDEDGTILEEGQEPAYDIVIANAVAYEGINLQVRTCRVYHLDLPWEPSTLQQRNGRAVRQGNKLAVVGIYYVMSRRSLDAVRFQMILGKLGWMKDLLRSADRETNNPAAGGDENEYLLAALFDNEEEGRAFLAAQEAQRKAEADARVRAESWRMLRGIVSKVGNLARSKDEIERAQLHRDIAAARDFLTSVPPEVWPWQMLVGLAVGGTPMLVADSYALWEGARFQGERLVAHANERGNYSMMSGEDKITFRFELGHVVGDGVGIRDFGHFKWHKLWRTAPKDAGEHADRAWVFANGQEVATPAEFQQPWSIEEDRQALDVPLRKFIDGLGSYGSDLEDLGLPLAPDTFRAWLWETYGAGILSQLGQRLYTQSIRVPIRQGQGLAVVHGQELQRRFADVIPFTDAGWQEYLARAARTGESVTWTDLNAASEYWWGLPTPKGLRAAAPLAEAA